MNLEQASPKIPVDIIILLNNPAIVPAKLSPAGKGEFVPIASNDTAESRKKNRRIDVILLPNIGELLKAVGDN